MLSFNNVFNVLLVLESIGWLIEFFGKIVCFISFDVIYVIFLTLINSG